MNKSMLKSKTVWGVIIAILSFAINKIFHSNIVLGGADGQAMDIVTGISELIGMGFAIYGRVVADVKVNMAAGKPWYKSQVIMSVGLSALIVIAELFHVDVSQYVGSIMGVAPDVKATEMGTDLLKEIPLIYALIGRVKATAPITG